jgi:epidermal growth factor receptor substrate 15
MGVRR